MKVRIIVFVAALLLAACTQEAAVPQDEASVPTPAPDMVAQDAEAPEPDAPQAVSENVDSAPVLAQAAAQPAPAPAAQQPATTQRDNRMVGIWVNENMINSGGSNFASYTTVMTMEIYADGRVFQYTESVGGGGDWSYDGGRTLDFQGEWRADGTTYSVYGMGLPDFIPAATYEFSGEYLVTYNDQGRLIWQRRG